MHLPLDFASNESVVHFQIGKHVETNTTFYELYRTYRPGIGAIKFRLPIQISGGNEPPHGKTNNLHTRKQRRRSASRLVCSANMMLNKINFFHLNQNCKLRVKISVTDMMY